MSFTAKYMNPESTLIERSDKPGVIVPKVAGNADYDEIITDGVVIAAYAAPPPTVSSRLGELAALRWEKETGGFTFAGAPITTDRESRGVIKDALDALDKGLATSVPFKTAAGAFVEMDKATLTALWAAMFAHVDACFDNEKSHMAALNLLSDPAAIAAYDISTGWPV